MSGINLPSPGQWHSHPVDNEIDLLEIVGILWESRSVIFATIFFFTCAGFIVSYMLPQKWTSVAIITPADSVQWQELEEKLTPLRVLGLDVGIDPNSVFYLFIKKFQSRSLQAKYLRSSSYVTKLLKQTKANHSDLLYAIAALSDKMTATDDNAGKKKDDLKPYTSWSLSFTASDARDAQTVLAGYINYITSLVVEEKTEEIREKLKIKIQFETARLAQELLKNKNQLNADIQRLDYALNIANAAGIKKPIYSNGQAVKDDPDFPVSLGSDGIARKLEIEKSITDVTALRGDLRNQKLLINCLANLKFNDVTFPPVNYQQEPSFPVKPDGVGESLILILSALVGGMVACGGVLLRFAVLRRVD
ncbi:LPS O-antigen length regulator Wzz(fepE) [Escherichia coli]|uniref:LPS O-antigen length regulator Wzz(fepE) n=1 Tax=Escherichia coli TaxID=562 RepID=UPI00287AABCF|nr:LPS O-antigen length regulator Wzz(fepE) [Escherichia coli]MDS1619820.1 LPS O-antigen length regulator Wzz(fepE) [Escherichia coli]